MRKILGLAAAGLIAAVVTLAAPSTSNAQVVVPSTPAVVTTTPVAYRAYRPHYRGHRVRHHRHGHRARGRSHTHRHHHGRHWRR